MSTEEAREFAESHGIAFVETSAKTGLNVEAAFRHLTQQIYDRVRSGEFQLEDGWDGIKRGFFGSQQARLQQQQQRQASSGLRRRASRNGSAQPSLLEGEALQSNCC